LQLCSSSFFFSLSSSNSLSFKQGTLKLVIVVCLRTFVSHMGFCTDFYMGPCTNRRFCDFFCRGLQLNLRLQLQYLRQRDSRCTCFGQYASEQISPAHCL
jgi:hypothetical protein